MDLQKNYNHPPNIFTFVPMHFKTLQIFAIVDECIQKCLPSSIQNWFISSSHLIQRFQTVRFINLISISRMFNHFLTAQIIFNFIDFSLKQWLAFLFSYLFSYTYQKLHSPKRNIAKKSKTRKIKQNNQFFQFSVWSKGEEKNRPYGKQKRSAIPFWFINIIYCCYIFNKNIMNRKLKWITEEENVLCQLRVQYGQNCWQKIAKDLNARFNKNFKTGPQCREKYINCYKFNQGNKEEQDWTEQEAKTLYRLYREQGPSWSTFVSYFPNKSINCLKNKFYNKLRKITRKLNEFQKQNFKTWRNLINYDHIAAILELSTQLQKWIHENNLQKSDDSKIFLTRDIILKLVFLCDENFSKQQMKDIVQNVRYLNTKLRRIGIFKCKIKKNWKLSEDKLEFIYRSDNQIKLQEQQDQSLQNQSSLKSPNQTSFVQSMEQKQSNESLLYSLDFQKLFFSSFNNDLFLLQEEIFDLQHHDCSDQSLNPYYF